MCGSNIAACVCRCADLVAQAEAQLGSYYHRRRQLDSDQLDAELDCALCGWSTVLLSRSRVAAEAKDIERAEVADALLELEIFDQMQRSMVRPEQRSRREQRAERWSDRLGRSMSPPKSATRPGPAARLPTLALSVCSRGFVTRRT
jgi:hypothetical protein